MAGRKTAPDEGLGVLQLPLAELCCVEPECADAGRRDHGNLSVRTGKGGGRWRILRCSTCRTFPSPNPLGRGDGPFRRLSAGANRHPPSPAVTWWVMLCYNFHHTHRSLRSKLADGAFMHRTPAMVAGLTHAPLTIADILATQLPGFTPISRPTTAEFGLHRPDGPAP